MYLDESQYFFLNDGWGIGLRGDDLDQHTVDEVPGGHLHMESVAAVLHTRLQHLASGWRGREAVMNGSGER